MLELVIARRPEPPRSLQSFPRTTASLTEGKVGPRLAAAIGGFDNTPDFCFPADDRFGGRHHLPARSGGLAERAEKFL